MLACTVFFLQSRVFTAVWHCTTKSLCLLYLQRVPLLSRAFVTTERACLSRQEASARTQAALNADEQPSLRQYFGYLLLLFFFFFILLIILATLLSPSLPVVTQIRGHIAGLPSPPLPTTVRTFTFTARRIQHFLPSSTRVELNLPTLLQ